jgi:membrane protein implicated in regulation of membrane protease activity
VFLILAFVLLFVLPSPWNFVGLAISIALFFPELFAWNRTVRGRSHVVGAQTLIGSEATVLEPCRPKGQVRVGGEIWEARCETGADRGETVRIIGRHELVLLVEPV